MLAPWKKSHDKPRQHIKKQRPYFADKDTSSQSYGFSVVMLDHKKSWVLQNWCFWTVVLEKTLKSPLDCKEIQPVHPKGDQPWIFIGRTDAEAEAPILLPSDAKSWIIGKDPDDGKDWRQEKKRTTENEIVRWHQRHNGHEFEQALGDGEGQGGLACSSPGVREESGMTEPLNKNSYLIFIEIQWERHWHLILMKGKEAQVLRSEASGLFPVKLQKVERHLSDWGPTWP